MKTRDVFSYSFSAIRLRKLRAGLTTLGVVIGIAAIVALLSITQGLQSAITLQLEKGLAADTLIVSVGRGGFGAGAGAGLGGGMGGGISGGTSGFKLLVNDTATINGLSPDIETSIAVIQKTCYLKAGDRMLTTNVVGVGFAQYANAYSSTFVAENGAISLSPDNDAVVIGARLSNPWNNDTLLFNVNDSVEIIWTNATARPPMNETYTGHITAVLKPIGGFGAGGPSDSGVYIPLSQAQSFFGTNECDTIIVKLKTSDQATIDSVTKAIEDYFNEVSVTSATAVLGTLSSVFSTINLFLGGIAAISLLVAGISIMNIMIVSLIERTREIGILKALGMKSRTVLFIFLCESVIIGLIGAVIGIVAGWGLANVVAFVFSGGGFVGNQTGIGGGGLRITPVLTPTVLAGALAFGIGVSVIFALYPAWRASKLKPVEALRYE
jgi:putative ABC transport system permease protein